MRAAVAKADMFHTAAHAMSAIENWLVSQKSASRSSQVYGVPSAQKYTAKANVERELGRQASSLKVM